MMEALGGGILLAVSAQCYDAGSHGGAKAKNGNHPGGDLQIHDLYSEDRPPQSLNILTVDGL